MALVDETKGCLHWLEDLSKLPRPAASPQELWITGPHMALDRHLRLEPSITAGFDKVLAIEKEWRGLTDQNMWMQFRQQDVPQGREMYLFNCKQTSPGEEFRPAHLIRTEGCDEGSYKVIRMVYYLAEGLFLIKPETREPALVAIEARPLLDLYQCQRIHYGLDARTHCTNCLRKCHPRACASCNTFFYCGRDCQTEDWELHREICKSYQQSRRS